jgi:hypothetical protein
MEFQDQIRLKLTNSKHSGSQKSGVTNRVRRKIHPSRPTCREKGEIRMKKSGATQRVLSAGMAVLAILAMGCLVPAFAGTVKFGHVAPPFHGQAKGVDAFAGYVKEKTGGAIEIATFPAGQLGGERSMAEQVQAGTLQIAALTTAVLQNFVPQCAILDMPFIFPDRKTAYATLDDPEVKERIFSYFPKKGFIAIGWTENEIRDFTNNKRRTTSKASRYGSWNPRPIWTPSSSWGPRQWAFRSRKPTTPCRPVSSMPRKTPSSPPFS